MITRTKISNVDIHLGTSWFFPRYLSFSWCTLTLAVYRFLHSHASLNDEIEVVQTIDSFLYNEFTS